MIEWLGQLASTAMAAVHQGEVSALMAISSIAALTEIGIPFPFMLDSALVTLGSKIDQVWLQALAVMFVLLVGRLGGSSAVYWIFRFVGKRLLAWLGRKSHRFPERLAKIVDKLGPRASVSVTAAHLCAGVPLGIAVGRAAIRVPVMVAIARLTPGLLTSASIVSGIIGLRYRYFVFGIVLASLFADGALLALGFTIETGLRAFGFAPPVWLIVLLFFVSVGLTWAIRHFILLRRRTAIPA